MVEVVVSAMNQSVLSPAGVQASSIHGLWLLMLAVCTVVFVCTLTAVFLAVIRGTGNRSKEESEIPREQTLARVVGSAVGLTVVTLIALLVASVWTGRTRCVLHASSAVTIAITGHQWWWEIEYEDAVPEPARPDGKRTAHSHEPAGRAEGDVARRHPQLLGTEPSGQARSHSRLHHGALAAGDRAPAYSAGSAPSSAECSTPTWPSTSSRSPIDDFEGWLEAMRQPGRDPPEADAIQGP